MSYLYDPMLRKIKKQADFIKARGSQEYTFAIRQSGTDAPTISVIKDDFDVTALTALYAGVGVYQIPINTLEFTSGDILILEISNSKTSSKEVKIELDGYDSAIIIYTYNSDGDLSNNVLDAELCAKISIQQKLD